MRRKVAAAVLAFVAVIAAGACSTPVYTSDTAVHDLERQANLTPTQAECIVAAIRKQFATEVKKTQQKRKLSALPADQVKLEVDGALATLQDPSASERALARIEIAACAPGALD